MVILPRISVVIFLRISEALYTKLPNHRWTGNMRELLACVENVATHREFVPPNSVAVTSVTPASLVAPATPMPKATLPPGPGPVNDRTVSAGDALAQGVREGSVLLKEVERKYILHVLELAGGSYKEAAKRLGIGWRKVRDTLEDKQPPTQATPATPATPQPEEERGEEERGEEESRASARAGR
jgi:DNA-binding NtrC family response regulator